VQGLTEISGLSARTYSCGGEGSRGGGGGEASTLGTFGLVGTFEKNLRIPSFFLSCKSSSISEGTDERSERSEESSAILLLWCFCG
jgi:hypothetical protein